MSNDFVPKKKYSRHFWTRSIASMLPSDAPYPRRLLIFEPDSDGHQQEWLLHLLRFAQNDNRCTPYFLVSPALADALRTEAAWLAPEILTLRPGELALCRSRYLAISGFARWFVMRRYLKRTCSDVGLFLFFDHLTLPFGLGLGLAKRRAMGILFRPSVHYGLLGPYVPTWAERVRDARKVLLYRLTLLNPALDVVLTLDPYFPAYAKQHYRGGRKVLSLVDPVNPNGDKDGPTPSWLQAIPSGLTLFVLFGYLTERKGVLTLLDALQELPYEDASRIGVLFAGRIAPEIAAEFDEKFRRLSEVQPLLWLGCENRRVGEGEIDLLLARADVVLAPYQRFVGSSGILLWAARAGKPVLTQNFGLIGRLVRDRHLGLVADVESKNGLLAAIRRVIHEGLDAFFDPASMQRFVAERPPHRFAGTIWHAALDC
jgi:glycosyltransferase involved in cell wall biosynthesis